jgi:hypothetical protein
MPRPFAHSLVARQSLLDKASEEDDESGQCTEDEISYRSGPSKWGNGPGRPIADAGGTEIGGY